MDYLDFFELHGGLYWLVILGAVAAMGVVRWATRRWQRTALDTPTCRRNAG
jgi:hypothetical protein